jgi:hypothetical protein
MDCSRAATQFLELGTLFLLHYNFWIDQQSNQNDLGTVTRLRNESATCTSGIKLTFFRSSLYRILYQRQWYKRMWYKRMSAHCGKENNHCKGTRAWILCLCQEGDGVNPNIANVDCCVLMGRDAGGRIMIFLGNPDVAKILKMLATRDLSWQLGGKLW